MEQEVTGDAIESRSFAAEVKVRCNGPVLW